MACCVLCVVCCVVLLGWLWCCLQSSLAWYSPLISNLFLDSLDHCFDWFVLTHSLHCAHDCSVGSLFQQHQHHQLQHQFKTIRTIFQLFPHPPTYPHTQPPRQLTIEHGLQRNQTSSDNCHRASPTLFFSQKENQSSHL